MYNLANPMDAAALLILGLVKCEGEISREQNQAIQQLLETGFRPERNAAADLLLANSQPLRDQVYLLDKLDRIWLEAAGTSVPGRRVPCPGWCGRSGRWSRALNEEQRKLLDATQRYFQRQTAKCGDWA